MRGAVRPAQSIGLASSATFLPQRPTPEVLKKGRENRAIIHSLETLRMGVWEYFLLILAGDHGVKCHTAHQNVASGDRISLTSTTSYHSILPSWVLMRLCAEETPPGQPNVNASSWESPTDPLSLV